MAQYSAVDVTIKQEHTHGTYSFQQFVYPRSRVLPKEIKRELSPAPLPSAVQVCPINVVQGDSILVKLKYKEGRYMYIWQSKSDAKHSLVNNW